MSHLLPRTHSARLLMTALALALVGVVAEAAAQDKTTPTATEVTDKIQNFYRTTEDYQASFTQIWTDVAAGDSKESGGRVFFKKPGKMRWDYLGKKGEKVELRKVLVSDGAVFTIYEPEFNQYFKQCLKESQLPTALSFLMGEGELTRDFTPKLLPSKKPGVHTVELTPKDTQGTYKKLVFIVDATTFEVQEAQIYDPYGNINRLVFSRAKVNKKLPDSGFVFAPPKTAKVVGGPADVKCE